MNARDPVGIEPRYTPCAWDPRYVRVSYIDQDGNDMNLVTFEPRRIEAEAEAGPIAPRSREDLMGFRLLVTPALAPL